MAAKGKRPMRALTPSDKIEAIQRVNDGESKASVARDIGVPESTLRGWCKNEDKLRYMTSRMSSPSGDTDKSNDGDPPEKRARTESPPTPKSSDTSGLDLSSNTSNTYAAQPAPPVTDAPVELTTKRSEPSPPVQSQRERRPDPGASVSMSAISPLTAFAHMPGLMRTSLGLSFNDVAHNLSILAQLNPSLSALSTQPVSRALRSIRSPKPSHTGLHHLSDSKHHHHRHRSNHSSSAELYRPSSSRASLAGNQSTLKPTEDLWLWLHQTQQARESTLRQAGLPLQSGKHSEATLPTKPVAPISPITSHLDYNTYQWFGGYRGIGGARSFPDDKVISASQVPNEAQKTAENILYSHLTKGKTDDDRGTATSPTLAQVQNKSQQMKILATLNGIPPAAELARSPEIGSENKEPTERPMETGRSHTKVRNVLDDILFINNQNANDETKGNLSSGQCDAGTAEALEHGEKFLAWCESSSDPSVTRVHLNQLRTLLNNLRTRRTSTITSVDAVRRK